MGFRSVCKSLVQWEPMLSCFVRATRSKPLNRFQHFGNHAHSETQVQRSPKPHYLSTPVLSERG